MTRWISDWSGVRTRRNVRAPAVIRFARLSAPTAVTTKLPPPLTTKLPEKTGSPGRFGIRSDSPVS